MLNILHVGLGPLGRIVVSDMAMRGVARVVAAADLDPALQDRPLSEIVPDCDYDCVVQPTIAAAVNSFNGKIDAAILTTSSDLARCVPSLQELIALGLPVVSTCEELLFPWLRHKKVSAELDELCQRHGARILGTGVNPGFLMDSLPVAATAVCRSVESLKVWRIQDATSRRLPFQKKIGAGLDDAAFAAKVREGTLRHVGLGESMHFIAQYLGMTVARWDESIEPVKAAHDIPAAIGIIRAGTASGVRQVARGWAPGTTKEDRPIIELEFQAAIGQTDPHDRVVIEGEPRIDLTIKGGVHGDIATSAITLNAIPSLIAATPGLHTMASVPMVHFVR